MRQKSVNQKPSSERIVKDIRRSVSCWTAFGVSTASRMLCWDITGQGNSIAFWINACAWPKNSNARVVALRDPLGRWSGLQDRPF